MEIRKRIIIIFGAKKVETSPKAFNMLVIKLLRLANAWGQEDQDAKNSPSLKIPEMTHLNQGCPLSHSTIIDDKGSAKLNIFIELNFLIQSMSFVLNIDEAEPNLPIPLQRITHINLLFYWNECM